MLQELNLQEMNEIKGGVLNSTIIANALCPVISAQIENNWYYWSQEEQQEAMDYFLALC